MKKIIIRPSFVLVFAIMIALGYPGQFFIMLLSILLHELAHIVTALYFKLNFKKIILRPIGEIAVMDTLNVVFYKRFLTILAGPTASAVVAVIAYIFFPQLEFFIVVNFIVCLFNLLPICTLDGGRMVYMLLSLRVGNLSAGKSVCMLAKAISFIFVLLGLVQIVLYPYNISLFCVGVYLLKINDKERVSMVFEFYRTLMQEGKNVIMTVKHYQVHKDTHIYKVINKICIDRFCVFYVEDKGNSMCTITQRQITDYAFKEGVNKTIGDMLL